MLNQVTILRKVAYTFTCS